MKTKILAFFVFLFSTLLVVSPVFAGGQLVSLIADSQGWVSDGGYGRTIRVFLHPEYPCQGTEITFKFVEPKEGDYINTGSGSSTYAMKEDRSPYYRNGVMGTTCGTYAKVSSKEPGERLFTAVVKNGDSVWRDPPIIRVAFDGKYYSDNHYNDYSYSSNSEDPYWSMTVSQKRESPTPTNNPPPEGNIKVRMVGQKYVDSPKRYINLEWNLLSGVVKYNIYARLANSKDWGAAVLGTGGNKGTIGINTALDYYVKVEGCTQPTKCISSNELFIAKMKENTSEVSDKEEVKEKAREEKILDNESGAREQLKTNNNQEVNKLNQKVEDLEKGLVESQQKQNALEIRLNNLLTWIKSIFPFFR